MGEIICKGDNCINLITGRGKTGLCKSCSRKGKYHWNYEDGRCSKQYYCNGKNCNRQISYATWKKHGNKALCISCALKKRNEILENRPNYQHGKRSKDAEYLCKECGKKIEGRGNTGLCYKCFSLTQKGKNHPLFGVTGENHPSYIDGRSSKILFCLECPKKITKSSKSGLCGSCATKKRLALPENNANWRGGTSKLPYPFEFDEILKNDVRTRDNFICQGKDCGMTQREHRLKHKKALSVHHIDYDKQNCSKENLITLCGGCNIKVNKKRKYWTKYFKQKVRRINNALSKR